MADYYSIPGLRICPHYFRVPLDHRKPHSGEAIQLFAREVIATDIDAKNLPWLIYFQGGPGFAGTLPLGNSGWLKPVLREFRVLILDQRGTGQSQAFDLSLLKVLSADEIQTDKLVDYLSLFRADQIVRDAEWIRSTLNIDKWTLMGQSYGGFCIFTYLSFFPQSVREVIITGGIPPVKRSPLQVYQATHQRMLNRNRDYFSRYPDDQGRCVELVRCLQNNIIYFNSGSRFTPERFQQLGILLGMAGEMETLHYLLALAFPDSRFTHPSFLFLHNVEKHLACFETNPLYAVLHESIYCQKRASDWAALRAKQELPEFDIPADGDFNFHFTGEMIYPSLFEHSKHLKPLKTIAERLAQKSDWPVLYDEEMLKQCHVPCAAVIYEDDVYVEREFSIESAKLLPRMRLWKTNEYEHNGIKIAPDRIFTHLHKMNRGEI